MQGSSLAPGGAASDGQAGTQIALLESSLNLAQQEIMSLERSNLELRQKLEDRSEECEKLTAKITKDSSDRSAADLLVADLREQL